MTPNTLVPLEHKLICYVCAASITVLGLFTGLLIALNWSWLAVLTSLFFASYPVIGISAYIYRQWRSSIVDTTVYSQHLKEDTSQIAKYSLAQKGLMADLKKAIAQLAKETLASSNTLDVILTTFDAWPNPVAVFDSSKKLVFRNQAMSLQIEQAMLTGSAAQELGFTYHNSQLSHVQFGQDWQCQTIKLYHQNNEQPLTLFTAINVSSLLSANQSITQRSLVRVLSHEIRNSLTPMQSMTDTLLSNQPLDINQATTVLSRVNIRSQRLLSFIDKYAKLAQLPAPTLQLTNLEKLLDGINTNLDNEQHYQFEFEGDPRCYVDPDMISLLFDNLFKNAIQAYSNHDKLHIFVTSIFKDNSHQIEVHDNGPGFSNLDNALTPFYTTKNRGSGIGLVLCEEIIKKHQGTLHIGHSDRLGGAVATITLPLVRLEN